MDKIHVIGVGAEGWASLTPPAREIISHADLVIGSERLLKLLPKNAPERLVISSGLDVLEHIEAAIGRRRIVVLASGDPGFFGIAKLLAGRLGKERVEIVPNVSSVQLAFARIKESWEDAAFISVHGRTLKGLAAVVGRSPKVAILTDDTNTPAAVARALLANGVEGYRAYLCENLGRPDERVQDIDLKDLAHVTASSLSVLVLLRENDSKAGAAMEGEGAEQCQGCGVWPLGIPDEEFYQRRPYRGQITKVEVRVVSLAKLGLAEGSVVWDVGSGSGSVAIEAAMIARRGQVYAIERNAENVEFIQRNLAKFGVNNVTVIHGSAPDALTGLPAPDAVFVGGSGGQLPAIVDVIERRLRAGGQVVVNAATLETAWIAMAAMRQKGFAVEATLMQVSRSKELSGLTHFEALDPVFIIAGRRKPSKTGADL